MSLDLDKLRKKLEQLKDPTKRSGGGGGAKKRWPVNKMSAGDEAVIRLVQYPHGDDPFIELHFHYDVGKPFLCPRMTEGRTCPVCEFAFSLLAEKTEKDKETAKKLFPRQRVFAAMIDRGDEEPTPRLWGFGKEMYQFFIEKLLSEEYGRFLDPVEGLDAEIVFKKRERSSYVYPELTFKRRESPLADSPEAIQEIMNAVPKIEDIYKPTEMKEINERLAEWLNMSDKDGSEVAVGQTARAVVEEADDVVSESGGEVDESIKDLDDKFEQALQD